MQCYKILQEQVCTKDFDYPMTQKPKKKFTMEDQYNFNFKK